MITKRHNLNTDNVSTRYFKLPHSGVFFRIVSKRMQRLNKLYCNDLIVKIVFSSFKIGTWLSLPERPCPLWSTMTCGL